MFITHPTGGLKLAAGAAVERKFGERKNKALIRLQAAYDFHLGNATLGPMSAWDLIEDQSNVVYVGFGLGFSICLDPAKAQMIDSAGEYAWGGAASTGFWIDPREEMTVIFLTQLMPSNTFNFRGQLKALTYSALI